MAKRQDYAFWRQLWPAIALPRHIYLSGLKALAEAWRPVILPSDSWETPTLTSAITPISCWWNRLISIKKELYTVTQAREKGLKRKFPPQIRLQQIRELGQFLANPPLEASRKLIIVEQAELMAEAAANGLLKTLEEPGRATLILIAPSCESLLPTLVSRCQRIPFSRLSREQMGDVLQMTGHGEILNYPAILAIAQGSPGVAIAAWEQQNAIPPELLEKLHDCPRSLRDALELAKEISKTLETPEQLWLLDYLQQTYWHSSGGSLSPIMLEALEEARRHLRRFVQPRLVWEVTLMKVVSPLDNV